MRAFVIAAIAGALLAASCSEGSDPTSTKIAGTGVSAGGNPADSSPPPPPPPQPPPPPPPRDTVIPGPTIGALNVAVVTIDSATGQSNTVAGATVRFFKQEVTVVVCDSTGQSPGCHNESYLVPGASDVTLPDGRVIRALLVSTDTTNVEGWASASNLSPGWYATIVDPLPGGPYGSKAETNVLILAGVPTYLTVFLSRR